MEWRKLLAIFIFTNRPVILKQKSRSRIVCEHARVCSVKLSCQVSLQTRNGISYDLQEFSVHMISTRKFSLYQVFLLLRAAFDMFWCFFEDSETNPSRYLIKHRTELHATCKKSQSKLMISLLLRAARYTFSRFFEVSETDPGRYLIKHRTECHATCKKTQSK